MAKIRKTAFKKHLTTLTREEMEAEMLKLFDKYKQVQDHYTQDLGDEQTRAALLEEYKKKLNAALRVGLGLKISTIKIRQIIAEFKQTSVFPYDLTQLMFHRIKLAVQFWDKTEDPYDVSSSFTSATYTAFTDFCKMVAAHALHAYFDKEVETLINADYNDIDLEDFIPIYNEHYGKKFPREYVNRQSFWSWTLPIVVRDDNEE